MLCSYTQRFISKFKRKLHRNSGYDGTWMRIILHRGWAGNGDIHAVKRRGNPLDGDQSGLSSLNITEIQIPCMLTKHNMLPPQEGHIWNVVPFHMQILIYYLSITNLRRHQLKKINRPGMRRMETIDFLKASAVWLMERQKLHISNEKSPGYFSEI